MAKYFSYFISYLNCFIIISSKVINSSLKSETERYYTEVRQQNLIDFIQNAMCLLYLFMIWPTDCVKSGEREAQFQN